MTFSDLNRYSERNIYDVKTLIEALRFFIVNLILAFIFLFLILEEFEWGLFSFRGGIKDSVIDQTSWDIKQIF
tara:strand:- start:82 stop:300 length:219 start_codon:yes stop_codon:yes gene_type:complete